MVGIGGKSGVVLNLHFVDQSASVTQVVFHQGHPMAKKKSKVVKKSAPKRPAKAATAKKKAKSKLPLKKKAAVKKSAAKSVVTRTTVKKKPAVKKSVVKRPTKVAKARTTRPAKVVSVDTHDAEHPTHLACSWSLSDVEVTYSQSTQITHFKYVRTNPQDCHVKIRYASQLGGPLDNEIAWPVDTGIADCSGNPQNWDAEQLISDGHLVRIQLFQHDVHMTKSVDTIVKSIP